MANHVSGTSTPIRVPPIALDELRRRVLIPLLGNPLFSAAEQLRANHFVHESDDIARLTRWGANVLAEITRRETAAARQRCHQAMRTILHRLRLSSFRSHRHRKRPTARPWAPGTFFPERTDRRAGTFDQLATARFQPVHTLTYAQLLRR